MSLVKGKRQIGIAGKIGVAKSKFYESKIDTAKSMAKLFNNAQQIFVEEFEKSEIAKGEKLAGEATPIYSEIEIPNNAGGTKKVQYVSGYNRPLAFNSSYAADKFDEEIAEQYVNAAVSDINRVIEDQRAFAVENNRPTDSLDTVTLGFMNGVSESTNLILEQLPDNIKNAVTLKTQNLITAATTELQNNHISEAKTYNNILGKNLIDQIDSASKNAFVNVDQYKEIKKESEQKLDVLVAKNSPMAFAYQEFKEGYNKIEKEAGRFNGYFQYDITNPDDITKGMENTIKLRQAAGLGQGELTLYNFKTNEYETFNMGSIDLAGTEGRQFLNQLRLTASEQHTVLSNLASQKSDYALFNKLKDTYNRTGSTVNLSTSNKSIMSNMLGDINSDAFKDLINEYNVTNNTAWTSNNVPSNVVQSIQLETIAKFQLLPSNIETNLELLTNARNIDDMMELYNRMNFQQLSNFKFESKAGDKTGNKQLNVINGLDFIDDKKLRDEIKVLDQFVDNYGPNAGLAMFIENRDRIKEMTTSNKNMKEMFLAQGVSTDDYTKKFTPAKLKEKIISEIQSDETFALDPLSDVGISADLVQNITTSLQTKLLLGANRSDTNITNMIKQEYMSAQKYMGFGRSKYNITPNGIITKNEEVDEVDYYLGRFSIDDIYDNNKIAQDYINEKINRVGKIRNLRTEAEKQDYVFGNNVFLITEGSPSSYDQVVYSMVYIPDKNNPSQFYPMVDDDGINIRFTYNDMAKTIKPNFAPVFNVQEFTESLKYNQRGQRIR